MSYLAWYLAIGVAVLAVFSISHRLSKKGESPSLSPLLDAVNAERKTLRYRIPNNIVAPILAAVLVLAVWPIALVVDGILRFSKKTDASMDKERKFAVTLGDLQELVTVEEIEQREKVFDPMRAVPDVPFGHLNAAWKKFLAGLEPQDAIWTFSAHWTTTWGRKDLRSGYAVVRGDAIGPYFLTMWKTLAPRIMVAYAEIRDLPARGNQSMTCAEYESTQHDSLFFRKSQHPARFFC